MDLALTRRGDYAVRAALCLAQRGGDGGYRLTRPPDQVPLLEVVEAAGGILERGCLRPNVWQSTPRGSPNFP